MLVGALGIGSVMFLDYARISDLSATITPFDYGPSTSSGTTSSILPGVVLSHLNSLALVSLRRHRLSSAASSKYVPSPPLNLSLRSLAFPLSLLCLCSYLV